MDIFKYKVSETKIIIIIMIIVKVKVKREIKHTFCTQSSGFISQIVEISVVLRDSIL